MLQQINDSSAPAVDQQAQHALTAVSLQVTLGNTSAVCAMRPSAVQGELLILPFLSAAGVPCSEIWLPSSAWFLSGSFLGRPCYCLFAFMPACAFSGVSCNRLAAKSQSGQDYQLYRTECRHHFAAAAAVVLQSQWHSAAYGLLPDCAKQTVLHSVHMSLQQSFCHKRARQQSVCHKRARPMAHCRVAIVLSITYCVLSIVNVIRLITSRLCCALIILQCTQ